MAVACQFTNSSYSCRIDQPKIIEDLATTPLMVTHQNHVNALLEYSRSTNMIDPAGFGMEFDGRLLSRGFWLYVWRIRSTEKDLYYVGRTGDNSSPHAQSPFNRIGQHLNPSANAKGNAMLRQLRTANVDPSACTFKMVAIGPLYPEQEDMTAHKVYRDKVAGLEWAVANHLRTRGMSVVGIHHTKAVAEPEVVAKVLAELSALLDVSL